jgi:CBS domain-containing protein
MQVKEVMTRDAKCVAPEAFLQEAAEKMKTLDVGALPVCDDNRLVGVLTDRDITVRATAHGSDPWMERVRDVMTPEVVYCFEDQDVNEAAQLMKQKQVRRLPVLDHDKHLVGIVALGDLAVETGAARLAGQALQGISEPNAPGR